MEVFSLYFYRTEGRIFESAINVKALLTWNSVHLAVLNMQEYIYIYYLYYLCNVFGFKKKNNLKKYQCW